MIKTILNTYQHKKIILNREKETLKVLMKESITFYLHKKKERKKKGQKQKERRKLH